MERGLDIACVLVCVCTLFRWEYLICVCVQTPTFDNFHGSLPDNEKFSKQPQLSPNTMNARG